MFPFEINVPTSLYVNKIHNPSSGKYNLADWHAMYNLTLDLQVVENFGKLPSKYVDVHMYM